MAPWVIEKHISVPPVTRQASQINPPYKQPQQPLPCLPANFFRRCNGDFLISGEYLMVAADSGAGINYARKTGHLSTGDLKASTPGRWETPEQRAPEHPHLKDRKPQHTGASECSHLKTGQDASAQGGSVAICWTCCVVLGGLFLAPRKQV